MVKITLTKKDNKIQKLEMTGHANSDEYGHDLVCAALTGIVSGALNAYDLDYHEDVEIEVKDNDIKITIKNLDNHDLQKTLEFLVNQIKTITIQYPNNANLKEVN